MPRNLLMITICGVLFSLAACDVSKPLPAVTTPDAAELLAGFQDPPASARPRTWFHAMSANMTREGLTKDLESLAEVGIGGLLLFNVSQGIPVGDVVYNSDRHHEMLAHAAAESERLGLSFGVHNCDGWSSSGGPWVRPEQSMKMLVYRETIIAGGDPVDVQLPQPSKREDYYEDIAVLAYPALATELDDRDNAPELRFSHALTSGELLTDGRIDAEVKLGRTKRDKPWVEFRYARPKTIRSAAATFTDRNATVTLQRQNEMGDFEDVRELYKVRTGKGEWAVNDHFDPVTATVFRMQFNQATTLRELGLTATYLLDNPLGRSLMARTETADLRPVGQPEPGMVIDPEQVLNLTRHLTADGRLRYDFPAGNWTVLRFGQTSTGAFNNPASWEGRGLEVDKMSRAAFKVHYDAFLRRVADEAGAAGPKALQYVEIDSYEAGGQNWTTGFDSIFLAEKGYDLLRFLPLMAGRFMGAHVERGGIPYLVGAGAGQEGRQSTSTAVLTDFRDVATELVTENYFRYFTELCHADGLKTYVEPYGFGPLNDLDVGGTCDIPMGEFWMNREITMVESAVSAAHIYGKPVISAESFTSTPQINWKGNPAMAKLSGDKAWARGINEFMFHRFAHQANPNVTPGMTMNRWGFHFDRTQTWWANAGADWFRYIARGSYLLRQGYPVADLMIFVGDGRPNSRFKWRDFTPAIPTWLNYDNVNTDVLLNRAGLADGAITLPEGGRYPLLALKNCDHLSLPTMKRLVEIAESGVTVIGEPPRMLAGYGHSEADYEAFNELADELAGMIRPLTDWEEITPTIFPPDLLIRGRDSLVYEHRRVGETDVYFFVNTNPEAIDFDLDFRVAAKLPEHWNPMTGAVSRLGRFRNDGDRTRVRLLLQPEESAFIVFRDSAEGSYAAAPTYELADGMREVTLDATGKPVALTEPEAVQTVTGPWQVAFRKADGFGGQVAFPELTDWKDHPDERVKYYSGTATYRTTFDFSPQDDLVYELDLGEVKIAAEVTLNGRPLGVQWMKPMRLNITEALREGTNKLEIAVTNLWSNRLIGEERYPRQDGGYEMAGRHPKKKMPAWYVDNEPLPPGPRTTFTTADFYDADDPLEPSGLLGPVRVVAMKALHLEADAATGR